MVSFRARKYWFVKSYLFIKNKNYFVKKTLPTLVEVVGDTVKTNTNQIQTMITKNLSNKNSELKNLATSFKTFQLL